MPPVLCMQLLIHLWFCRLVWWRLRDLFHYPSLSWWAPSLTWALDESREALVDYWSCCLIFPLPYIASAWIKVVLC